MVHFVKNKKALNVYAYVELLLYPKQYSFTKQQHYVIALANRSVAH